jgi:predicted transport protein
MQVARRARRQEVARVAADVQGASMVELAGAVDEALLGLGDGANRVERKQYRTYQRLRNFACLCPPQRSKLLVYLKVDPTDVDLIPGFTRDVSGLGHYGTGDLEVQLRTPKDVERAQDLFRASYAFVAALMPWGYAFRRAGRAWRWTNNDGRRLHGHAMR